MAMLRRSLSLARALPKNVLPSRPAPRTYVRSAGTGHNPSTFCGGGTEDTLTMHDLGFLSMGHSAFQYLNSACEIGLFKLLSDRPNITLEDTMKALNLKIRPARCLLMGCVALKLIIKNGDTYRNAAVVDKMFQPGGDWEPFYHLVRFQAVICYGGQEDLVDSLQQDTNVGLRRFPGKSRDLYTRLSETDPLHQKVFFDYMGSWSRLSNHLLLDNVDLSGVKHALDVGGGDASNAIAIATANPNMRITLLDLPENAPVSRGNIAKANLSDRIGVHECNFHNDPFPQGADCFLFLHQLVIWPTEANQKLIQRAYEALPAGGKVVIMSSMANDEEDGPVFSVLDSVYFICSPAEGGMIYPWKDYEQALRSSGFSKVDRYVANSWTPHGVIVATK